MRLEQTVWDKCPKKMAGEMETLLGETHLHLQVRPSERRHITEGLEPVFTCPRSEKLILHKDEEANILLVKVTDFLIQYLTNGAGTAKTLFRTRESGSTNIYVTPHTLLFCLQPFPTIFS